MSRNALSQEVQITSSDILKQSIFVLQAYGLEEYWYTKYIPVKRLKLLIILSIQLCVPNWNAFIFAFSVVSANNKILFRYML